MTLHPDLEYLQLFVDERMSALDRAELELHLTSCPSCMAHVMELRQLLHGLESIDELELPSSFARELAEEVAPSPGLAVQPARRTLITQAVLCLVILLTCGALLLVVDTPVTDPSNDVLGAIDVLLGSPFQIQASIIGVLAIMVLAGLGVLACLLSASPYPRPRRHLPVASRASRDSQHRR
jgi:anti-sigma factor RsiW